MIGAEDGDCLAGFAILRSELTPEMAELKALYVSRPYRRMGIAQRLVDEVERLAVEAGATRLYVSATPSNSAVGFYQQCGFGLIATPHPDLFAAEPEDIHMVKDLRGSEAGTRTA